MSRIHRVDFMARQFHIDLDKIIAINDAIFIDRMGSGGYFVGFSIECQLRDEPLILERELVRDLEEKFSLTQGHLALLTDGSWVNDPGWRNHQDIFAVRQLQQDVDRFIEEWKK